MKLVVVSHKKCWGQPNRPETAVTIGGFPQHMQGVSSLFDETRLVLPHFGTQPPKGAVPLAGPTISVRFLTKPFGTNLVRKLAMLIWLPRNLPAIWSEVRGADAVHVPIPGDVGTIGILIALLQRKRLFIRHCATWGDPETLTNRLVDCLLRRIAGGRVEVMATGGGNKPPSGNSEISWIFSSSLTDREMNAIPPRQKVWRPGDTLRLATVCRLSRNKNVEAAIRALPAIRQTYPDTILEIAGEGPCRQELEELAKTERVDEAVTFHGNLDHQGVLNLLTKADLFVFPTRVKEGFPKAVLEAMAHGLPVLAPAVSVLPFLLEGCGVLLENTEAPTLAEAVATAIADEGRFAAMAAEAQRKSRQYTLENWGKTIGERLKRRWGQSLKSREPDHV